MQSTDSEIGSDPDELFARSSVAEVRNIEKRMRYYGQNRERH